MKNKINHPQPESWNAAKDGLFSEKALKQKMEKMGYMVSRYVYPPGTCFPDHTHSCDKMDGVVAGTFRMRTPEIDVVLCAGDCLVVPKGTVHSAEVIGSEPVISFDGTR